MMRMIPNARLFPASLGLSLGLTLGLAAPTPAPAQTRPQAAPDTFFGAFFGSVRAREIASLSYGARGCVTEVAETAENGGAVAAGAVLVRLDDQRAALALRTAEARLFELQAAVEERALAVASAEADARRRQQELTFVGEEFERSSAMLDRGLINESAMDTVERRYMDATFAAERATEAIASAEAAAKRAELALEIGQLDRQSAEIDLSKFTLAVPFDGILAGFDATVGACVQEGELAGQVYMPDQKSVDVYLQVRLLTGAAGGGLAVDAPVRVLRVNDEACAGTIARIDTEADLENQLVQVTVDVDETCAPRLFLNESVKIEVGSDEAALTRP